MKKRKKTKMKFNPDKAFRNFTVLITIVSISILVYKIATNGISFLSTIGYFN